VTRIPPSRVGAEWFASNRFTSPIAVKGRIIVAGDNKVFAFKPQ
jgi:hypothetical protein